MRSAPLPPPALTHLVSPPPAAMQTLGICPVFAQPRLDTLVQGHMCCGAGALPRSQVGPVSGSAHCPFLPLQRALLYNAASEVSMAPDSGDSVRGLWKDATGPAAFSHAVGYDSKSRSELLWGIPCRMLDPSLRIPYPTSIFVRASAIIVNFESIRLVIAHDRALVLSVPVPEQSLLRGMPARWGSACQAHHIYSYLSSPFKLVVSLHLHQST